MRHKKTWRVVALFAIIALVAAACGSDDGGDGDGATGGTIIIGTTDSIAGLDSADAYAVHDWELIRNTGEGLMKFTPGTADVVPGIAESFEITNDGKTYTFTLREGVEFYDGTALTAGDYVTHLNRLINLDGDGGVGGALAKPYIESVDAPDDRTVVINLLDAISYFPSIVTSAAYHPMHPSFPTDALVEFPEAPFGGVGPWVVTSYTLGEQTVLEPNENYYGDAPKADRIIIRYFTEAPQLVQALQNGEIDIAWRSVQEPQLLQTLADESNITSAVVPGGPIRYIIVNRALAPTDDVNVRKAIAAALDRDEVVDGPLGGNAEPLYSPIPPGFLGANEVYDDLYKSPNPTLVQDLLAESGYTPDNPLQINLDYPPDRYGGVVGDAIQTIKTQLESASDGAIQAELRATEWATYLGNVITGESYNISFLGWFFDYPDSSNYVEPFTLFGGLGTNATDADSNAPHPNNTQPDMVAKMQQAASETDSAARAALYEEIQQLYAEDVVTIPLWVEPERVFYADYISGDSGEAEANSLNIGPTTNFEYALISTTKEES